MSLEQERVPPNRAVWTESEIGACFDDAFEHLSAGDFVSAAASFQRVIDESGHARGRSIAQRNLEWWCLPIEAIVTKLKDSFRVFTLDVLLEECLGPDAPAEYRQQVSDSLRKISTICCLGDQLWIHRSCLETVIGLIITWFREGGLPVTLGEIAHRLLLELDCQSLPVSEQVENILSTELANIDGILVVKDGCIFDETSLQSLRTALIALIRKRRKPTRLTDVVDSMPWPQSVKSALQPSALGKWLCSQRGGEAELSELGDSWWFISGLLDLTRAPVDEVFEDRFDTLDTNTIVLRHLFGGSQQEPRSVERLAQLASEQLARNLSVIRVKDDTWFLAQTANDLIESMVGHLGRTNQPVPLKELLKAVRPPGQRRFFIPDSALAFLASGLRQDEHVLEVCETTWLHRSAMGSILDQVYRSLQDSTPRSASELLARCLWGSVKPCRCYPTFMKEFESALHVDNRFTVDRRQDLWSAIPPGDPQNDLAYVILHREHRPLTRQAIVEQAKNMPHRQSLDFQLDGDSRFKRMTDGRWMLEQWILINHLAASYLAQSPIPLLAETVKQRVCQAHNIPLTHAIFEPEDDPRFVRAPLGKWSCPCPGTIVTADTLERLVMAAGNATDGIRLEVLTRRALHEDPSAFIDLEQALQTDGRLVYCDDRWYPRDKCFYSVTSDDLDQIKAYLVQAGYPIPAKILAQVCLSRLVCLTDLRERLVESAGFVELGSAGWTVRDLKLEYRPRGRDVNYPVRSGKYLPSIDPVEFERVEEEEQSEPDHDLSIEPSDESKAESRVRSMSIPLSFEDLRDGTLAVTARLGSLLSYGIDLPAVRFVDESGGGFSCWYDADNKLLYGFGEWFRSRGLTYGDKVRLSITKQKDQFSIQVVGERNEQVYLEGVRRSHVQSLIDEAKRVNRSYHDLALEVLEHFGIPLHIDDLWGIVNYRRTARKGTLSAILSSRSYFVSEGAGHWRFDKEEYARMIRDLERRVKRLERENQELRDRNAELGQPASESLQHQMEELETLLKASQESCRRYERQIEELRGKVEAANKQISDAEATASQAMQETSRLQDSFADDRQRIEELDENLERQIDAVSALEQEREELRARVAQLSMKTKAMSDAEVSLNEKVARLDDRLRKASQETAELRQQNEEVGTDNVRLRKEVEALVNQVHESTTLAAEHEQLKADLMTFQAALASSEEENQRLSADLAAANEQADRSQVGADQASAERKQVDASLAAAERESQTLASKVREKNETIGRLEEQNQILSAEMASLTTQVTALKEQHSQLNEQIGDLEKALQRATGEPKAFKEESKSLGAELAEQEAEKQRLEKHLADLTRDLESLQAEHARAMWILDSWGGRLAKWWAMIRSRDLAT